MTDTPAPTETHPFIESPFSPDRCRDCDHPSSWHPTPAPTPPRPTESIDRLRSEANMARYADELAEAHYEDIYAVLDWAEAAEALDVDALREAGWEPDFNVCASCHHRGGAHDLSNKCLICGDRFSAMSNDEKWAWGVAEYARLRSQKDDL